MGRVRVQVSRAPLLWFNRGDVIDSNNPLSFPRTSVCAAARPLADGGCIPMVSAMDLRLVTRYPTWFWTSPDTQSFSPKRFLKR